MTTINYQLTTINYKEVFAFRRHNRDLAFPSLDSQFYKTQVYNHYRLIG
jgi:hypothetical protein